MIATLRAHRNDLDGATTEVVVQLEQLAVFLSTEVEEWHSTVLLTLRLEDRPKDAVPEQ